MFYFDKKKFVENYFYVEIVECLSELKGWMGFYWLLRIEKWKYVKFIWIMFGNFGVESLFYGWVIVEDLMFYIWYCSSL